ncbi:endolytic peptidoglycan transglycosylase RlpA [Thalassotalea marina]|uniref:Endolytic peptidoglycan transglycosylase RlpA n=2 Tax=Thalassotalea marina TaxID=1673741 RepID=A0A919EI32_9GAMM|nr:endolytic peptidoglycan transglycosylase RlpA [Thalassotalea marina]
MLNMNYIVLLFLIIVISGCSANYGRYQQKHDSTPTRKPTAVELQDAVPRTEVKSRGGNRHYTVRGKYYKVLQSAEGFTEVGEASWYGKKFHGHLTSNGEIYNMYGMSAAHKNLPLPTYVKVTNLANDKSVIVRVNDRGPFHQDRIIDLSYSAAYKLDMLKTGTTKVQIQAITEQTVSPPLVKKSNIKGNYIQVFATSNEDVAKKTSQAISSLYKYPTEIMRISQLYKVKVGPIEDSQELQSILEQLKSQGYPEAFRVIF